MSLLLGRGLTHQDFVEISHSANHRKWDDRMGKKPKGFDAMKPAKQMDFLRPYCLELGILTSEYDRLHYLNCVSGTSSGIMTEKEFGRFFEKHFLRQELKRQKKKFEQKTVIKPHLLNAENAIYDLSELVRSMELGTIVLNEEYQRTMPDYCKQYQEHIVPFYRAAINVLAGLDQSANWLDIRDLYRKVD